MKLSDHLNASSFELELVSALHKFVPRHLKACSTDTTLNYNDYGTDREVKLKKILTFYGNISTVLDDLESSLKFLEKDRRKILQDYPFLESQEAYYKYHHENYYIRIATINDIVGRLGTLLFSFDIDLKRASSYVLKDKAKKEGYDEIVLIVEKLIDKLEYLKEERHKKLHTGEADLRMLTGFVIWEDLNRLLGHETDEVLTEYADQEIVKVIQNIRSQTIEIIKIVSDFIQNVTGKLKEIIESS